MARSARFLLASVLAAAATSASPDSYQAGFRIGADIDEVVALDFGEAYFSVAAPRTWRPAGELAVEVLAEFAAGIISAPSDTAGVFKAGPAFRVSWGDFPLSAKASFSPTVLTRSEFDGWDVGGHFHLTSAADIEWHFLPRWSLGYHIQHTSNADLGYPNPGIDLHAIELGYRF